MQIDKIGLVHRGSISHGEKRTGGPFCISHTGCSMLQRLDMAVRSIIVLFFAMREIILPDN